MKRKGGEKEEREIDCLSEQHTQISTAGSNVGLLKIDFRNAFNEIKRSYFVEAACNVELD